MQSSLFPSISKLLYLFLSKHLPQMLCSAFNDFYDIPVVSDSTPLVTDNQRKTLKGYILYGSRHRSSKRETERRFFCIVVVTDNESEEPKGHLLHTVHGSSHR